MKEILKKLDYDRRPVLLAYQRFIKEEWVHLPDSEHINSTGDHDGPPPQPDPLPAPPKQPPPSKQIEEQMDLLNYLEACLEDHNRFGYPPIEGLEGMVKQMTPKQVRGPEAIKKFIVEQRAKLSRSRDGSGSDNASEVQAQRQSPSHDSAQPDFPPPSMEILNSLEACLEAEQGIEKMEEAITILTSKSARGPEAIRKFIAEQRARHSLSSDCSDSNNASELQAQRQNPSQDSGNHFETPPELESFSAPSMEMLNYLEACLERGHLIEEMEEAITGLTSRSVRGPEAIRKFIEEQRARHSPSSDCSGSDHNNKTAATSPTAPATYAPATATTSESDLDSDPESAPVPTPDPHSAPAPTPGPAARCSDKDGELQAQPSRNVGGNGGNNYSTPDDGGDGSSNGLTKEERELLQQTSDYDSDSWDCEDYDSNSDRPNRQRCFLAELKRELDGYYGEFLQSGFRNGRLDYVLGELEIDDSLSIQATEDAIDELWERLQCSNQDCASDSDSSSGTSRHSSSTHDTLNSKPRRQLLRLGPTRDQLFIMAHVEMAYQEKRAHAINEEMHGWTNGGEEGLDDHIAALCSKLSKDQIAFLEQQWDQFYREASEEDLDGDDVKYRLHRYEELGQSHDFNINDYSEQQKRIFADCGLCSTWDDGSSRSGSNYSDSECDAFDNGAHAVDSSFLRWQQQRQLQSQQRQGSLQSMIERPPQVITMPGPGQKIPCIGNRPTNGSNEDGSLDSGGGLTAGSAFATASAPAPTPAPALPSTSETASDSAPAPTPALVSDSEEETPPVSDSEEETSLTGRKHFYGRTKRTKGTARRTQEPKTTVDSELNRARDIWLMGRVSK